MKKLNVASIDVTKNVTILEKLGYDPEQGFSASDFSWTKKTFTRKEDGKSYKEFAAEGLLLNMENGVQVPIKIDRVTIGHDVDYEEDIDLLYAGRLSFSNHGRDDAEPFWMLTRASQAGEAAFTDDELGNDPD